MGDTHERFMRACIELAKQAVEHGDPPFGSVLVHDGQIILKGHNTTATENNFMRHAELNILCQALEQFGTDIFPQCILYSSNEPCPMCSGAIYWGGVRQVVYGLSAKALMEIRGWGLDVSGHEVLLQGTDEVRVLGGVMEKEVRELHEAFWKS